MHAGLQVEVHTIVPGFVRDHDDAVSTNVMMQPVGVISEPKPVPVVDRPKVETVGYADCFTNAIS